MRNNGTDNTEGGDDGVFDSSELDLFGSLETRNPPSQTVRGPDITQGRDELNLAEFPLSAISDRLDPNQKTMVFEDRIFDGGRGEMIKRQLTITASDQYGLPTAMDDEVMLALVQISKQQKFQGRKVNFNRAQIIALLNWGDSGRSYDRLETALNRWVGVTLYYEKAWWDKAGQCWRDEKFHILDNVSIVNREPRSGGGYQPELALSSFTWNDVIWRSFEAGNLKSLDFGFYVDLKGAISKRLYRFLDKRFWHRGECQFELREFCCEHIGLSRNYDSANLKRKLRPAIEELEAKGFLIKIAPADRFKKTAQGIWHVFFHKAYPLKLEPQSRAGGSPLVSALTERGVGAEVAKELCSGYSPEVIAQQIESFDFLMSSKDRKITRNPAGYLVSAIRGEYAKPAEMTSEQDQKKKAAESAARKAKREAKKQEAVELEKAKALAKRRAIDGFWTDLPKALRARYEREALATADSITKRFLERQDEIGKSARQGLLDQFALKMMSEG